MGDEEIELYHIARSPPPSTDDEDVAGHEAYRQFLATRPLPPPPIASPPRRRAAFPTLLSPLSDPFIDRRANPGNAGSPAEGGRQTIRVVPASSGMLCPALTCGLTLLTACSHLSSLSLHLSEHNEHVFRITIPLSTRATRTTIEAGISTGPFLGVSWAAMGFWHSYIGDRADCYDNCKTSSPRWKVSEHEKDDFGNVRGCSGRFTAQRKTIQAFRKGKSTIKNDMIPFSHFSSM